MQPTPQEKARATRILNGLLALVPGQRFKIGRCGSSTCDTRWNGEDYSGTQVVISIIPGPPSVIEALERYLIAWSWRKHPRLCKNKQVGGGQVSRDKVHHVYVAIWPRTKTTVR